MLTDQLGNLNHSYNDNEVIFNHFFLNLDLFLEMSHQHNMQKCFKMASFYTSKTSVCSTSSIRKIPLINSCFEFVYYFECRGCQGPLLWYLLINKICLVHCRPLKSNRLVFIHH